MSTIMVLVGLLLSVMVSYAALGVLLVAGIKVILSLLPALSDYEVRTISRLFLEEEKLRSAKCNIKVINNKITEHFTTEQ